MRCNQIRFIYEEVNCFHARLGQELPNTQIVSDNIRTPIGALKQQSGKDILVFGSPSAVHALLQEDLVDEFWLFVNPVILGQGIPLFEDVKDRIKLKLVQSVSFSSGVVCLHYQTVDSH